VNSWGRSRSPRSRTGSAGAACSQINLVGYAALAVVCAFSTDATMLIASRFALGVGLGAELALADAYLAELLPPSHRGRLATTHCPTRPR
jgi:MFS family permease